MTVRSRFACRAMVLLSVSLVTAFVPFLVRPAAAQYNQWKITADTPGQAPHSDPNLVNPWGLAFFPKSPFWVSDAGTGFSTLYKNWGYATVPLVVTIPPAPGSTAKGSPSGIVANGTGEFKVTEGTKSGSAVFIFDTLDGTISGWSPAVSFAHAVVAVNGSSHGAAFTGLAIGTVEVTINNVPVSENFIYTANVAQGHLGMFDGNFQKVKEFTDPDAVAEGFVPYNVQNIGGKLYVTFVNWSLPGAGNGYVDVFDTAGNFVKTLAEGGTLNFPWGIALAPSNFGKFSNDLLVGNQGDGRINAFDPVTGKFLGQLANYRTGQPISIDGLWALVFGAGSFSNGPTNWLFFTAGPNHSENGWFGVINHPQF